MNDRLSQGWNDKVSETNLTSPDDLELLCVFRGEKDVKA